MPEEPTQRVYPSSLPDVLEDTHPLLLTTLAPGYAIGRYSGTGTIGIQSFADGKVTLVKNSSPVTAAALCFPLFITTHENDTLQTIDIRNTVTNKYDQPSGLFFHSLFPFSFTLFFCCKQEPLMK